MQPHIWFWVWALVSAVLVIAEILSPGLFALPFAIGASAAAVLELVRPGSITWQWIAFFGLSSLLFIAGQWALRLMRRPG